MATVTFIQGSDISETVIIKDSDGNPIDITGGTVKFRIVDDKTDTEAEALFVENDLTITDGPNGEAALVITSAVTILWPVGGTYHWEVEYVDSASKKSHTDTDVCIIQKSIYANG
jgi:hypothetical protein